MSNVLCCSAIADVELRIASDLIPQYCTSYDPIAAQCSTQCSHENTSEAARAALFAGRVRCFAFAGRVAAAAAAAAARTGRVARAAAVAGAPVATKLEEVVDLLQREHVVLNRRPDRVGQNGRDGVRRASPRPLPNRAAIGRSGERSRLGDGRVLADARRTRSQAAAS